MFKPVGAIKTVHRVKKKPSLLYGKEKVPATIVRKKVMLTVSWEMKGPITIDFLEKDTTVNSATYTRFTLIIE